LRGRGNTPIPNILIKKKVNRKGQKSGVNSTRIVKGTNTGKNVNLKGARSRSLEVFSPVEKKKSGRGQEGWLLGQGKEGGNACSP